MECGAEESAQRKDRDLLNGNRGRALHIVSDFIQTSLDVVRQGENPSQDYIWLAAQTGLRRRAINAYAIGRSLPSDERFARIADALGAKYKTIYDLVSDPDLAWD